MLRWLVQTSADHPNLLAASPPPKLLTAHEIDYYRTLLSPRRRRDWLLGRWTAKCLAQTHFRLQHGFTPALDSFGIEYAPSGAPRFHSNHPALSGASPEQRVPVALSISHSGGYAFCAIGDDCTGEHRVGADIELVKPQGADFVEQFFTHAEQRNVNAAPLALRPTLIMATWSVKEAALKAAQVGLRADPLTVECMITAEMPRHWSRLYVHLQPQVRAHFANDTPLSAWWRVINNRLRPSTHFVLTLVACGLTL
jgi:4'-phosphopantetheinyl transferase